MSTPAAPSPSPPADGATPRRSLRRQGAGRLLRWAVVSAITLRIPILIASVALLVVLAAGWPRLSPRLDLLSSLPEHDPVASLERRVTELFGVQEPIVVVIEAREPGRSFELKSFAELFAQIANDRRYFASADVRLEPILESILLDRASPDLLNFVAAGDVAEIESRLQPAALRAWMPALRQRLLLRAGDNTARLRADALRLFEPIRTRFLASMGPVAFEPDDGYFLAPDRRSIAVVLRPRRPSGDVAFAGETIDFLRRASATVFDNADARRSYRVHFFGPHVEAARQWDQLAVGVTRVFFAGVVLTAAFLLIAFRRISALFILGVPWLVVAEGVPGLAGTLGIEFMPLGFSALVLGLIATSLFSVHYYSRVIEEAARPAETSLRRPLAAAAEQVGWLHLLIVAGVACCSIATLVGSVPGWHQFALVTMISVTMGFVATYALVPALATVIVRERTHRAVSQRFSNFGLRYLAHAGVRMPAMAIALTVLGTAYLGFFAATMDGDIDSEGFLGIATELGDETPLDLASDLNLPSATVSVLVSAPTLTGALERNDRLYDELWARREEFDLQTITSLRTLLPSLRSQEETRRRLLALNIDSMDATARQVAADNDLNFDQLLAPSFEWLRSLQEAAKRHPYVEWGAIRHDRAVRLIRAGVRRTGSNGYAILTRLYLTGPGARDTVPALRRAIADLNRNIVAEGNYQVSSPAVLSRQLAELLRIDYVKIGSVLVLLGAAGVILGVRRWHDRALLWVTACLGVAFGAGVVSLRYDGIEYVDLLLVPGLGLLLMATAAHILARAQEAQDGGYGGALLPGESYTETESSCMAGAVLAGRPSTIVTCLYGLIFLMFSTSDLPMLARLGSVGALGLVCVLVVAQVVLPALMVLARRPRPLALPPPIEPADTGDASLTPSTSAADSRASTAPA